VFAEDIDAMISKAERDAVIMGIMAEPDGGDLIPGGGGLRKRPFPCPGAASAAARG
jgi:hypothetical protein